MNDTRLYVKNNKLKPSPATSCHLVTFPLAEFMHNQCLSATTGQTPFSMIMGYMPKVEWPSAPSQVPSYTDRMEQIEVCKAMKTSLEKAQKMMAIRNSSNKKFWPYQKDDQVWIEGTNLKTLYPLAKLAPKRYGPFKVMKQLSPAVYEIKIPHQWKVHNVFHANLIVMDAHILSYLSVFYTDLFDEVFVFESFSLDMIR